MKVAIIQSCYLPWRGYFDFIDDVDLFVVYDDIQFTRRDWRNRNQIKTATGRQWLTVPVRYGPRGQLIRDTLVDDAQPWPAHHARALQLSYARAPHYAAYRDPLLALLDQPFATISQLNVALIEWVMSQLAITTPLRRSEELVPQGRRTERLIDVLRKVGATAYVSGPTASAYLEVDQFAAAGIGLEYKAYDYPEYPQLWGAFEPHVSILDLLFNCGAESRQWLKSRSPNEVVLAPGTR